jgi:hypothetical protein
MFHGVVSVRAYALAPPLEESEHLGCADVECGVSELVDMLLDARLSCKRLDEALATLMQKYSMDGDDFSCEMEMALIEECDDEQGLEDGRGIQVKLERAAMNEIPYQLHPKIRRMIRYYAFIRLCLMRKKRGRRVIYGTRSHVHSHVDWRL